MTLAVSAAQSRHHSTIAHYVRGVVTGLLIALTFAALLLASDRARHREDRRRVGEHLRHDLATIKAGQADEIFVYEAELLEMIAADPQAMANATTLVFSNADFADPRFSAVAELKVLRNVAINSSRNADALLAHMQDMESIEKLYIEQSPISASGIAALRTLPNLKHLRFEQPVSKKEANLLKKTLPKVNVRLSYVTPEDSSI
jgi:hypothetical protein